MKQGGQDKFDTFQDARKRTEAEGMQCDVNEWMNGWMLLPWQ